MAKTTKNKSPKSDVRDEMGGRVQKLYAVFVLLALIIVVRLVWVVAISPEVDFNTDRIKNRIFRESTVYARRGSVLSRHGDPMAISIMRYKVEFDMASEGFDSEDIFEERSTPSRSCLPSISVADQSTMPRSSLMAAATASRLWIRVRMSGCTTRMQAL